MITKLSLLMIRNNSNDLLKKSLDSTSGLVNEYIIINNREVDLGKKRAEGLKKVTNEWVLALDSDEIVSAELQKEIVKLLNGSIVEYDGYLIPFQNHFLGRSINYGGENYKMLRLFRKDAVTIKPALIHEHFEISGKTGELKNKILHYSYRSLPQMFGKFTDYAFREAKQKLKNREKTSLKKIILYPLHMFWARFVEDKGFKDGLFRLPLDLGFAYMEFLTYVLIMFIKKNSKLKTQMSKLKLKT